MQINMDSQANEPAGGDLRLVLLLVALSSLGLLMWAGLFLAVEWSMLTAWAVASAA